MIKDSSAAIAESTRNRKAPRSMTAQLDVNSATVANRRADAVHVLCPIRLGRNHGQVPRVHTLSIVALVRHLMRLRVPKGQASTLLLSHRNDDMGII